MGRWLSKDALEERRQLVEKLIDEKKFSVEQVARRLGIHSACVWRDYRKIQSRRAAP
jgi:DNA invertase Pin-like site-specific DNA recombinase